MLVSKMLAPSLAKLLMHLCALSKPCSMLEDAHEVQLTRQVCTARVPAFEGTTRRRFPHREAPVDMRKGLLAGCLVGVLGAQALQRAPRLRALCPVWPRAGLEPYGCACTFATLL